MNSIIDLSNDPHRRKNPLTGEWILVSPHRTKRPWQGQQEKPVAADALVHDPNCYLCPGNERVGGIRNPDYEGTFVFTNDFSAMLPNSPSGISGSNLLQLQGVSGESRVICFSPRHDVSLAQMELADIGRVVNTWADQISELGGRYPWVQLFENKGASMGASNPHPHGQLWASDFLPTLPAREDFFQRAYFEETGRPLLLDVVEEELTSMERVVVQTKHWVLLVPFWATWPFEYLLLPKRAVNQLPELTEDERSDLAVILKDGLGRYDGLFETSFPYSMGWHGAPTDGDDHPEWILHAHYYPPLLRSASVRKFMVGYEMLAESQRDLTPEMAAQRLRDVAANRT